MFTPIDEYIAKSRDERRAHLDLTQPCHLIGGYDSREYRGLLAHTLKTTIPTGNKNIMLCHACNVAGCSNPKHLYWGTRKDNHIDSVDAGTYESMYARTLKKLGAEAMRELQSRSGSKGGRAERRK